MKFAAEFVSSVSALGAYPRWERSEVALAGRSNVGKSSLLNALVASRGLARTSKTPGRTRAVNFFDLGNNLALVDLPGYGYARMGRAEATQIGLLVRDYLTQRELLRTLILLVDARRGPEEEELALLAIQAERPAHYDREVATIVVATKSDKVRPAQRSAALKRFTVHGIEPIMCSALNGEGIEPLRRRIVAVAGV
jgi:GTP-binding protein